MSERSSHAPAPAAASDSGSTPRVVRDGSSKSGRPAVEADGDQTIISSRPPIASLAFANSGAPLETGRLLEGERLGQFLLQEFVGGGGMGIVFRALDTTLNREVAVKVLSRDQSADDETLRRFRNEAQSAARLNHDNIARVHYVGEDRGVHYIVFEFIEGVNIRDLVAQRGPLPLEEALSFAYQITLALDHASQRDVIHRDIKPSNVLITPDGKAKLVDMGLARLNQMAANDDLTASGVTLGTFDYISPEQARDPRSADVRSDLYSLGCSLYYMLTGHPPFPDGTVLQKLLQHQGDQPPDPRAVRPELPPEITHILARLLAKNPAHRFQQPSELIDELSALGDSIGMQLSRSRSVWVTPRQAHPLARWQYHLPWAVPLAILFLVVVSMDFYWSNGRTELVSPAKAPAAKTLSPEGQQRRGPPLDDRAQQRARETIDNTIESRPEVANNGPHESNIDVPQPGPTRVVQKPIVGAKQQPNPLGEDMVRRVAGIFGQALQNLDKKVLQGQGARNTAGTKPRPANVDDDYSTLDAAPALADGPATANPSSPLPPRDGLLIVSDEPGPRSYTTLHAACNDAKSGDVIELRYNGRRLERPLTITNIKLTIRAAESFQPVVVFRPDPIIDPAIYPSGMLTIAGGQFKAINVHWEFDLPRTVPADWALFETRRAELVQFQRCTFTVRNAALNHGSYHAGVSIFDIKAPPGAGSMAMDQNGTDESTLALELKDCIARGEATLLRTGELQPVRLQWDNGLLATSERLLVTAGSSVQPRQMGHVQINLRHVTVAVNGGLALLANTEEARYQLLADFNCADSLFVTGGAAPLIEQRGPDRLEEYLSRLQWRSDRNFFDGFEVFWQISSGAASAGSRQQRFPEWQDFWRGQASMERSGEVSWRALPGSDRASHSHTLSDYALDATATFNPAIAGSSDGLDAGAIVRDMPALPSDEPGENRGSQRSAPAATRGSLNP